jgi:hypothetical protein
MSFLGTIGVVLALCYFSCGSPVERRQSQTPSPETSPVQYQPGELNFYYSEMLKLEIQCDKTEYFMGEAIVFTLTVTNQARKPLPLPEQWLTRVRMALRFSAECGYDESFVSLTNIFGQPPVVLQPSQQLVHTFVFDNRLDCRRISGTSFHYGLRRGDLAVSVMVSPPAEDGLVQETKGKIESNRLNITLKGESGVPVTRGIDPYGIQTRHWVSQLTHKEALVRENAMNGLFSHLQRCYKYIKAIADSGADTSVVKAAQEFLNRLDIKGGLTLVLLPLLCEDRELRVTLYVINISGENVKAYRPYVPRTNPGIVKFEAADAKGEKITLVLPPELNSDQRSEPEVLELPPGSVDPAAADTFFLHSWRTEEGKTLSPGKYFVTASYIVSPELAKDNHVWTGTVRSNQIEVQVKPR